MTEHTNTHARREKKTHAKVQSFSHWGDKTAQAQRQEAHTKNGMIFALWFIRVIVVDDGAQIIREDQSQRSADWLAG